MMMMLKVDRGRLVLCYLHKKEKMKEGCFCREIVCFCYIGMSGFQSDGFLVMSGFCVTD